MTWQQPDDAADSNNRVQLPLISSGYCSLSKLSKIESEQRHGENNDAHTVLSLKAGKNLQNNGENVEL